MTIRHVIMDEPLKCFAQMVTALKLAEQHGAQLHLTPGCYGEPTRKRPGMDSDCMPRGAAGGDRCRHDTAALRAEGAISIGADTPCWTYGRSECGICRGVQGAQIALPDEYPVPIPMGRPAQGALF